MYSNIFDLINPDFIIDCRDFETSAAIYKYIRSFGNPKIYCYAICYRKGLSIEFLKIGESAPSPGDKTAESIGERIKRQLNHVPGWEGDPPYYSDHGNDFCQILYVKSILVIYLILQRMICLWVFGT